MPDLSIAQKKAGVKRERKRIDSLKIDKEKIAKRIKKFYDDDTTNRSGDIDARLQRYAKLRQWTSGKNWPWEEASDVALPDILTHSLRIQDTLHNAVMSIRPTINSKAVSGKEDIEKQEKIDNLIDYQIFMENEGEKFMGDAASAFVDDGVMTIYIPWVREDREIIDIRIYPSIPSEALPIQYFKQLLTEEFPKGLITKKDKDGWEWEVEEEEIKKCSFYTTEDSVELLIRHTARIFDGPRPMVLDYDDVLYPYRAENLQAPGPSNPNGSAHVIVRSYPLVDEIKRLKRSRFYDLVTDEDVTKLEAAGTPKDDQASKQQKDRMQGTVEPGSTTVASHKPLTRLMCFDRYDIDGDGLDEDVVWWSVLETGTILKAKYLTEMFPANPPRRPFAESSFIPVRGRRSGISLPELLEGMHDLAKTTIDLTIDGGTAANFPFGFYRATSNMKAEVIRVNPNELYPLGDPKNDVYYPSLPGQSQAFGINLLTIVDQIQSKLAMQSDLQFGRIPKGQASALRTQGAQQNILMQGEARPERILRRFFMGLCEVWKQIHELNQRFLPENKKFRIIGYSENKNDPYDEVKSRREIQGRFQFDFKANVLNSSKQILQTALQSLMAAYLNPVTIQLGLMDEEGAFRLLRNYGKSLGQDPDQYLKAPAPDSYLPPILAEEAISLMIQDQEPKGKPLEGSLPHLQKLIKFMQSPEFGFLSPDGIKIFQQYAIQIRERAVQEQRQQIMAQFMAQQMQQESGGQPTDLQNPQLNNNELIDKTLPSAGGGGNV